MSYPLIVAASTTASGKSLTQYRRRLAPKAGQFALGVVSQIPDGLEPERYAVANALRSDFAPNDKFDGLFCYVASGSPAPSQQAVVNGGFDGPNGAVMVDYPFDSVLEIGSVFELSVLPAESYLGVTGMNEIINLALEELPVGDRITVVSDGTRRVSLMNYPWPIKGIGQVYEPTSSADEDLQPLCGRWSFVNDAESPFIQLPYTIASGTEFVIEVLRPASTRIRHNNAWGDTADGLVLETDEALYDLETVARTALPIVLEREAITFKRGSKERQEVMGEAGEKAVEMAFTKFYASFRGSGAQRAGAVRRGR